MTSESPYRRAVRRPSSVEAPSSLRAPARRAVAPSRRAHVLVVGSPTPSHVYPSLPLIRELVRRGLRVTYAVGEPVVDLVASTGAEILPCTSVMSTSDGDASLKDPVAVTELFLEEAIQMLPQLRAGMSGDLPDVVLFNTSAAAGDIAASGWGVPALELTPTSVEPEYTSDEALSAALDDIYAMPGGREMIAKRLEWAEREGVGFDLERIMRGPRRTLCLIPRVMQPEIERVSSSKLFVGPLFDEVRLSAGEWSPPPGNELPVVLVSFGTIFTGQRDLYRACIEALGDGRHHLVVAVGRHVDPAEFGPLPPYVEVHRTVPQLAVLRHAKAFVTHGGMGSVVEALWFGVPMMVIPQAADQFNNGTLVHRLGIARTGAPERVSVDSLRRDVRFLLQDIGVRMRMVKQAREVRAGSDLAGAADVVQRLVSVSGER